MSTHIEPFKVLEAHAAALMQANVDTDLVIRVERCSRTPRERLGEYAFEMARFAGGNGDTGAPDPAFPHDCGVRTDAPEFLPPRQLLLKHTAVLEDQHAKELLISPRGLRIVWLAEEASRGNYLLFRDSEMGREPLPAAQLKPLLDFLIALRDDLAAHPETST